MAPHAPPPVSRRHVLIGRMDVSASGRGRRRPDIYVRRRVVRVALRCNGFVDSVAVSTGAAGEKKRGWSCWLIVAVRSPLASGNGRSLRALRRVERTEFFPSTHDDVAVYAPFGFSVSLAF
jgi:hypothetical protein